jgi:hypothetical protein
MSEINPQEFGRLQAQVAALEKSMAAMQADVRVIRDAVTEARGGWRTLLLLGGAAATMGGAIAWALQHVKLS